MGKAKEIAIRIPLPHLDRVKDGKPERAKLSLQTYKPYSGGLLSSARVDFVSPEGWQTHACGLGGGGGDYSRSFFHNKAARATQSAIDKQHAEVFTPDVIAGIQSAIVLHYARQK